MSEDRKQYQILIVEDTIEFAELTLLALERAGLSARHAANGLEAIDMINESKPDLVLLDLNLPGMSGWKVLEHLSATYGESSTPVIVTSAYGDGANRVIGKLQSVHRYMIKPFSPRELIKVVEDALGLSVQQPKS